MIQITRLGNTCSKNHLPLIDERRKDDQKEERNWYKEDWERHVDIVLISLQKKDALNNFFLLLKIKIWR
jgi:hypothetical protein